MTKYWSMNWSKMNFKYFLLLTHTGKTLTLFQPFPMVFDMYLLPSLEKAMATHSSTLAWKIPWWAAVHGVVKSRTQLSDFTFTFHFHALEKEMATHSSVLAWRIPGKGEPGGLPSMGSHSWIWLKWLSSSSSSSSSLPWYGNGSLKGHQFGRNFSKSEKILFSIVLLFLWHVLSIHKKKEKRKKE